MFLRKSWSVSVLPRFDEQDKQAVEIASHHSLVPRFGDASCLLSGYEIFGLSTGGVGARPHNGVFFAMYDLLGVA
jgi:hypothetical protein